MKIKVYNAAGALIARCVHAEDAAVLLAVQGDGAFAEHRSELGFYTWIQQEGAIHSLATCRWDAKRGNVATGDASESYDTVAEWLDPPVAS